jgi:hypothetical protein
LYDYRFENASNAELLRKHIDMHLTAMVLMSVYFGYMTYTYSYQRITVVTTDCAVI